MYRLVLVFFIFFIFIALDAYFRAERISIGINKAIKLILRIIVLIAFNVIFYLIIDAKPTYELVFNLNLFLFFTWWIFYNGLSNIIEGHHWFYPHLNNEIERKIYKGSGVRAIVKQSFFHLLLLTLLIASFLYLFK